MIWIDNAREVLLKAWSVRLAAATTLFSLFELANEILPFVSTFVPSKTFAALAAICGIGTLVTRFLKQNLGAKS